MMRRVLFSLAVLMTALVLSEAVARAAGRSLLPRSRSLEAFPGEADPNEPNMVGDIVTGWRARVGGQRSFGIPGGTFVNSRGLRGGELPIPKPAGIRRVLLVGDSTVFGVLVADGDTFAYRVQVALQQIDPNITVLNAGTPGWSSWQARRALDDRLLDYEPDLLVIATLWSDAQRTSRSDADRFPATLPVLDQSRAFLILREWVREVRYGGAMERVWVGLQPPRESPAPSSRPPEPAEIRVPLPDYEANLAAMARMVADRGGSAAYLVLPCVRDPAAGIVGDFRDDYRAAMRRAAASSGAPIADTPAAFVGTDPGQMFLDDVHPTVAGHAKVAEVLARTLEPWARGAAGQ